MSLGDNVNVVIRFYEQGDDEGIVSLLTRTFPKWASFNDPLGLWRWKYIETPFKSLITVALIDGKIIGCDNSVIYRAKLGSEIIDLGYNDDVAVDSRFRGLGIWNRIRSKRDTEFYNLAEYKFSTTVNPIVIKSWEKRSLRLFPFPVTRMVKSKNIELFLKERPVKNRYIVKLAYLGLNSLNHMKNIFKPAYTRNDAFQIIRVTEFDDSVDFFWDKIKEDYGFILEKKKEYLNWRFSDNDRGRHVIFLAVKDENILGYVVGGFKPESSEGLIEDLLALKDRLDVADALLDAACKYLDDLGVNAVFYQVVVGHPYQGLSGRRGFIDSRSRPSIQFDHVDDLNTSAIDSLENITPRRVYFSYATTI